MPVKPSRELAEWWLNESMDEYAIGHVDMKKAAPALARFIDSIRAEGREVAEAARSFLSYTPDDEVNNQAAVEYIARRQRLGKALRRLDGDDS